MGRGARDFIGEDPHATVGHLDEGVVVESAEREQERELLREVRHQCGNLKFYAHGQS
jgi:hypothetical protein